MTRIRSRTTRTTVFWVSVLGVGSLLSFSGFHAKTASLTGTRSFAKEPGHLHAPQGSVIGREDPAQIPTDIAYRLFLRTLANLDKGTPDGKQRQLAYLRHIENATGAQLANSDRDVLLSAARLYVQLDESVIRQTAPSELRARRIAITRDSMAEVSASLSQNGLAAISQYIEVVLKKKIVRLG